jgi:hypothetical protein
MKLLQETKARTPLRAQKTCWRRAAECAPCLPVLLLLCASTCLAQRDPDSRPKPLDPIEGEKQARALIADMLAQRPEQNTTNTGLVRIRDVNGKERQVPARFEVYTTPTNFVSVYEALPAPGSSGAMKLAVYHNGTHPNRYELWEPEAPGGTNTVPRVLAPDQLMVPFAGSDFWVADLGLEFLHWPQQRVLQGEMRHSKACKKLESINPAPEPGGYSRVVSWIMVERPHGLVHADAYDMKGEVLKRFDPTNLEKVEGEYQLEEIEMRNRKTGSETFIKFNLNK